MKSAPTAAIAATRATMTVAAASARRPLKRRSSRSTAGFSASARKRAMNTHASTCRDSMTILSTAAAATRIPITKRTVRARNRTSRSCSACTCAASRGRRTVPFGAVSLRGRTIEQTATLPDGRSVTVHVGVPDDPYIPRSQLETVDVELHAGGTVLAAVNTVLDPDEESGAVELARE